jgi:hypothetical protein
MVRPLFLKPQWMNGLSERLLVSHYENNYGYALRRRNAAQRPRLSRMPAFEINGLATAQLMGIDMASPVSAETAMFENGDVGGPPRGWLLTMTGKGAPNWTVERDEGGRAVLKQSGRATYPVALKHGTSVRDGFVEVIFKPISGSEDQAGGIVWRARDANNYYVVRANALEDNVVLYKTVNGVRSSLDLVGQKGGYGVKTAVPANQWHTLRIEFAGPRFNVSFNGKPLFTVEDAAFSEAGMVGLWTKADSVTLFSGFTYGERP